VFASNPTNLVIDHQRLFRADQHRWIVTVRGDAMPGGGYAATGGIAGHHVAGCGGERERVRDPG
jgi:hypothetical protein